MLVCRINGKASLAPGRVPSLLSFLALAAFALASLLEGFVGVDVGCVIGFCKLLSLVVKIWSKSVNKVIIRV